MGQLIELRVLGGFRLFVDGSPVTARWATRRSSELVQLLALAPGHRLVRDQIVEAILARSGLIGGHGQSAQDGFPRAPDAGGRRCVRVFADQLAPHPAALRQRAIVLDALGDAGALGAYDAAIAVADPSEVDELRAP